MSGLGRMDALSREILTPSSASKHASQAVRDLLVHHTANAFAMICAMLAHHDPFAISWGHSSWGIQDIRILSSDGATSQPVRASGDLIVLLSTVFHCGFYAILSVSTL